ncbi:hypothetical protein L7F22_039713 [Adiantum nelumboides]|nr:hypothetical protein [Adiantum nelumboides]
MAQKSLHQSWRNRIEEGSQRQGIPEPFGYFVLKEGDTSTHQPRELWGKDRVVLGEDYRLASGAFGDFLTFSVDVLFGKGIWQKPYSAMERSTKGMEKKMSVLVRDAS